MTENTNAESPPNEDETWHSATISEKIDVIADNVIANNDMLNSIIEAMNMLLPKLAPPPQNQAGVPYQAGYPQEAAPKASEYSNQYNDQSEYSSPDESHRDSRTYAQNMAPVQGAFANQPPSHHPPPVPPGGMPPPHTQNTPTAVPRPLTGPQGERIMTPEEYRNENPE